MQRCLECEACKYYMTELAAHRAAIAESEDPQAALASWNAFKTRHDEEFKCTNPKEED